MFQRRNKNIKSPILSDLTDRLPNFLETDDSTPKTIRTNFPDQNQSQTNITLLHQVDVICSGTQLAQLTSDCSDSICCKFQTAEAIKRPALCLIEQTNVATALHDASLIEQTNVATALHDAKCRNQIIYFS